MKLAKLVNSILEGISDFVRVPNTGLSVMPDPNDPGLNSTIPGPESQDSIDANKLGLQYIGKGRWVDTTGTLAARSVNGKLYLLKRKNLK